MQKEKRLNLAVILDILSWIASVQNKFRTLAKFWMNRIVNALSKFYGPPTKQRGCKYKVCASKSGRWLGDNLENPPFLRNSLEYDKKFWAMSKNNHNSWYLVKFGTKAAVDLRKTH